MPLLKCKYTPTAEYKPKRLKQTRRLSNLSAHKLYAKKRRRQSYKKISRIRMLKSSFIFPRRTCRKGFRLFRGKAYDDTFVLVTNEYNYLKKVPYLIWKGNLKICWALSSFLYFKTMYDCLTFSSKKGWFHKSVTFALL